MTSQPVDDRRSFSSKGRTALITGAGRGMGRATALRLAMDGASVCVNDINKEAVESTVSHIRTAGGEATGVVADITESSEVASLFDEAVAAFGSVDILINNAGVLRSTRLLDIPDEEWDFVLKVNLRGPFLCSRQAIPIMAAAGWGRIVNLSSTAGKNVSTVGGAHYTASKAGVLGLTRHTASEVANLGITANAVCPGLIGTEMVRSAISEEQLDAYAKQFPISRLGLETEVADAIAFLVSAEAGYITGAALDINGGDLMI